MLALPLPVSRLWTYDDTVMQVSVAGQRPDQYLEGFKWDEAKYPPRRALNETVSAITETTQKLEDDLKVPFTSNRAHVDKYCNLFFMMLPAVQKYVKSFAFGLQSLHSAAFEVEMLQEMPKLENTFANFPCRSA